MNSIQISLFRGSRGPLASSWKRKRTMRFAIYTVESQTSDRATGNKYDSNITVHAKAELVEVVAKQECNKKIDQ